MSQTLIPPIGTKGSFTFTPPFDTLMNEDQEYRVGAVRNLTELQNSGEDPYDTIYNSIGLTEVDFKSDLDNNIPIVVFVTTGEEYIYVPADRVLSIPKITGVRYQELVLAISLGNIPVDLDLDVIKDMIVNDIQTVVGIESTVAEVPASAVGLMDIIKHKEYMALLEGRKVTNKSYRTLYEETLELLANKETQYNALEKYIKENYVTDDPVIP